jgi:hypothetical protein
MITANDLQGIMAMMPAFTTKDSDRPDAEDTIDTGELSRAVDQIIRQTHSGMADSNCREELFTRQSEGSNPQ